MACLICARHRTRSGSIIATGQLCSILDTCCQPMVKACNTNLYRRFTYTFLQNFHRVGASAANPGVQKEKTRRLALVDMLLWDFNPEADISNESSSVRTKNAWLAPVVHAVVGIAMRALSFQLTDLAFVLFQDTIPGPWQGSAASADTKGRLWLSKMNA